MNDDPNDTLLDMVLRLKTILLTISTSGLSNNNFGSYAKEYSNIRRHLKANDDIRNRIPHCVNDSQSLEEFWASIRADYGTYEQRRIYLKKEFYNIIEYLELKETSPNDEIITGLFVKLNLGEINRQWKKALGRRLDDPEGAITASRTLIESICKLILEKRNINYKTDEPLQSLYSKTIKELNLSIDNVTDQDLKKLSGACNVIVDSLARLRNDLGDAHGNCGNKIMPEQWYADFCVNIAGALGAFLISAWNKQNEEIDA
jgi:hypothetical protein